jgi:hypothetical protein
MLEATVILKGDDQTGDVAGGHVRMSGLMRRPNQGISRWAAEKRHQMFEWYTNVTTGMGTGRLATRVEGLSTYKRAAMFAHLLTNIEPHFRVAPLPGECAEFADFDTDNYERHMVVIV